VSEGVDVAEGDGEGTRALKWLNRAYDLKDPSLTFVRTDLLFDGLLTDPGFKLLLRKMKFPG
jgi:hypothetical protein